jgi:hydrogenase maturation factor
MATNLAPRSLPVGKLPAEALAALLARLPATDPRVLIGARPGEDAAVVAIGDRCLVVTTDPVTFVRDRVGWYAVHVNANDVAVLGAAPQWFFAVLLLPEGRTNLALVSEIFDDVRETCAAVGASLCGGHTEITAGLERPIVVGQMIGEVSAERLVRKEHLRVGDQVLLTQGVAIEGTAILAREKRAALEGRVAAALLDRAQQMLFTPGISVVEAARIATSAGEVHAMHDPTEGGLVSGLVELAHAASAGLRIEPERIHVFPETRAISEAFGVDPLRLIASGALLVGAPPADIAPIRHALAARGIPSSVIGEVVSAGQGIRMRQQDQWVEIVPPERDELARVLGG